MYDRNAHSGGTRRGLAVVLAAAMVAWTFSPVAAWADSGSAELALPAPTGPLPVGRTTLHLVDRERSDPWVADQRRELMVSIWYPAAGVRGPRARYVSAAESELILAAREVTGEPADVLSTTRTHARLDVPVLSRGRLPLVVLSPGFALPRTSLTGLAEELASHGYVVAGIDHNHESVATTFPGGRITECLAGDLDPDGPTVAGDRATDVSFVLDRLTGPASPWWGGWVIDPSRIAVVGHSMGGAAAVRSMLADRRIRAGVNLDGAFQPTLDRELDRPVLIVGAAERGRPPGNPDWTESWSRLTGWKRWLGVDDMSHTSFTDFAPLEEQLGRRLQPLPARRCVQITRAYVTAFLDEHLRGRSPSVLDGPTPEFPEVRFWHP
ncbi:alpha/beta fold hydrolase [Micromonospora sp. NPDC049523]|uniref:alpha/beta hydrolase family protein n=1 Tax=Micromonospora sp. NPDC049523 TaxID=3155921 RepID=UPI003416EF51